MVESVGADVGGFAPGDRVLGYFTHGAARERVAVPAQKLFKLTAALDLERAAGLTVTYGTAYHALVDRARLKRRRDAGGARRLRRRRAGDGRDSASSWARA